MPEKVAILERELQQLPATPENLHRRIDLLNDLGWQFREPVEVDRLLALAGEAAELSRTSGYRKGLAGSMRNQAFARYMRSEYGPAVAERMYRAKA